MPNTEKIILPYNLPTWKHVVKFIAEINNNYDNFKSISDVINILRKIKNIFDGTNPNDYSHDCFSGLGLYLQKYNKDELQRFISNNFRNILFYVRMIDSFVNSNINTLSFSNNVIQLSFAALKSLVGCSLLCLLPQKIVYNGDNYNKCDHQMININCDDLLYQGIIFCSNNHSEILDKILQYFSINHKQILDSELQKMITLSLYKSKIDPLIPFNENLTSWPIIMTSHFSSNEIPEITENMWPVCFEDITATNHSYRLQLKCEKSFDIECPIMVVILPILTVGSVDLLDSNAINISFDGKQHTLYRILSIDPWNCNKQFSLDHLEMNSSLSYLAFQSLIAKYKVGGSIFLKNFTDSVIENAINKLSLTLSSEILNSNFSKINITDSRRLEHPSLSNIFYNSKRPRDVSISTSTPISRSARQSYSTSSSSRSGSLQLSTLSSRRSSSKDQDYFSTLADKGDFASHIFHPIILEESNFQVDDDDECILLTNHSFQEFSRITDYSINESQFDNLMSAPISDSTKLSLSKDYLNMIEENSLRTNLNRRRNSSPAFCSLISKDIYKNSYDITKIRIQTNTRCCEEDESNIRLASLNWNRSNSHGRRQSLPCHLQWLYQLPLTDSIKLNLSQSKMFNTETENNFKSTNITISRWSQHFINNCLIVSSQNILKNIINFANELLVQILPNELFRKNQSELRKEIITYKSEIMGEFYLKGSNSLQNISYSSETLKGKDLSSFNKELYSTNFLDDEALQYFRKFSDIPSDNNSFHDIWMDFNIKKKTDCKTSESKPSILKKSFIDYVTQLTDGIIAEAIIRESNTSQVSSTISLNQFAENISVNVIARSMAELAHKSEKGSNVIHPIYLNKFPYGYHNELGIVLQILSASWCQHQNGHSLILVCDTGGNLHIKELIEIINQNKDILTPNHMYKIMLQYFTNDVLRKKMRFKDFLIKLLQE